MLVPSLTIVRKEICDGFRDFRSLASSFFYELMGPIVVGLVTLSGRGGNSAEGNVAGLFGLITVFVLVAPFVGGMNVAMDTVAGERERRSLLPLLANPLSSYQVAIGKWLATSMFAGYGLVINLIGFGVVIAALPGLRVLPVRPGALVLVVSLGLFPLAFLAAATQVAISTYCRSVKEAHTYLAYLTFVPMTTGMFVVFSPELFRQWWGIIPIIGQELMLETCAKGGSVPFLQALILGLLTFVVALAAVVGTAHLLRRDEIIYGN